MCLWVGLGICCLLGKCCPQDKNKSFNLIESLGLWPISVNKTRSRHFLTGLVTSGKNASSCKSG